MAAVLCRSPSRFSCSGHQSQYWPGSQCAVGLLTGWLCSCVSTATPCGITEKKGLHHWGSRFSGAYGWTKQPWELGSRGRRILQREGQGWLQSILTKPLSGREPVLPSWSQWRRRRCAHLLSPGRSYLLTQQGKIRTSQLEGSERFDKTWKANQTTSQANHQMIFLQQKPY